MKNKRKKGFTLIELIAVLVILAILALIVTPLVMNIVKKAKDASNRRSVDAYGKSVELAVATYLLDNGYYPESLDNLTVEYSGNEVTCLTKTLNSDGYYHYGKLVGGSVSPENPTAGYDAYEIGDEVSYNNVDYYVIKNSDSTESSVTLLKKIPLTVAEVNQYGGVGTENNHVNMYNSCSDNSYYHTAYNNNGYGGMAYYSSANCGHGDDSNDTNSECTTDYARSDVKYVVDAWKQDKVPLASEARLITLDELRNDLGYGESYSAYSVVPSAVPSWVYSSNYDYWAMTPQSADTVWNVRSSGMLGYPDINRAQIDVVRPVITISKSLLSN